MRSFLTGVLPLVSQTEPKDLLFISTERYGVCVLEFDATSQQLVTRASGDVAVSDSVMATLYITCAVSSLAWAALPGPHWSAGGLWPDCFRRSPMPLDCTPPGCWGAQGGLGT